MRMKKYEITDIAHPDNPKLHRIRALTDVGTDVHKGDLGGFVETEDNLDQEGFAWIGKDAIACEDSYIGGDAILADSAVARDSAYVGNNAVIADHAVVQDNAIVCGGYISGNSCICGSAILNSDEQTRCAPMIGGNARVYPTWPSAQREEALPQADRAAGVVLSLSIRIGCAPSQAAPPQLCRAAGCL